MGGEPATSRLGGFVLVALAALLAPAGAEGAGVIYVRADLATGANDGSSWANAFQGVLGLQAALGVAAPGDEIWVAQGTYKPAPVGQTSVSFAMLDDVALYGGFVGDETARQQRDPVLHVSRLSGDLAGDGNNSTSDNSEKVVSATGVGSGALLDGFTISGGYARWNGVGTEGGGLRIAGGAPTIRACTFSQNKGDFYGGDVGIRDATPLIEACTFTGTTHASIGLGIYHTGTSAATVSGCAFVGSPPTTGGNAGIGIYTNAMSPDPLVVVGCTFSMITEEFSCPPGVGIYVAEGASIDVSDCDFIDNFTCGGGGGIHCDGTGSVDRCTFIGNEGLFDGGAALFSFEGELLVSNCVFAGNDRDGFSSITAQGVMHFVNCTFFDNGASGTFHNTIIAFNEEAMTLDNCIFWANKSSAGTAAAVVDNRFGAPEPIFTSCIVRGWNSSFVGTNSFAADPKFVDEMGADGITGTPDDDLRLAPGSPAIDSGRNASLPAGATLDLDGSPRFADDPSVADTGIGTAPIVDRGAYEAAGIVPPACVADLSGDGATDVFDFSLFAQAFGQAAAPGTGADLDGSGLVDVLDFAIFAADFGCPMGGP